MSPVAPKTPASPLEKYHVVRSDDLLHHRLFTDSWDFVMYARTSPEARRVEFYMYDPDEASALFDPSRPAFTMVHSRDQQEWRLVSEKCDRCQFSPKHKTCACIGKQQVSFARHLRKPLERGSGMVNCMEVAVPALTADGEPVVWCPRTRPGDLAASPASGSREVQKLVSKCPTWNEEVESLVLDFKGRTIQASAKNFQLALSEKPNDVVCQYAKVGPTTFGLDFKRPLSVIQAFALSISTMFWS